MSVTDSLMVITEDALSETVLRRLLRNVGYSGAAQIFRIARGNGAIRKNLDKYKGASNIIPHIVLTDWTSIPVHRRS